MNQDEISAEILPEIRNMKMFLPRNGCQTIYLPFKEFINPLNHAAGINAMNPLDLKVSGEKERLTIRHVRLLDGYKFKVAALESSLPAKPGSSQCRTRAGLAR